MKISYLVVAAGLSLPLAAQATMEWSDMAFGFDKRAELRKSWDDHEKRAVTERNQARLQSNLIQAKHLADAVKNADSRAQALIKEISGGK